MSHSWPRMALSGTVMAAALLASASGTSVAKRGQYLAICEAIAGNITSASEVFYPLSLGYTNDLEHWMTSSSQDSECTVEPGTSADVGVILQILGATSTPFSVKGGGHASNPGYSSSPGVQISMHRFSAVDVDEAASTATIGTGLIWDDVYSALEPYSVNVIGGRVTGVGVAGFSLGGGYSWKSNQYGLTIDSIVQFDLVLPNGTFVEVTEDTYPDLMWGLKGGFNNFGIVTQMVMKTYPQTEVWGGLITYTANEVAAVTNATYNFAATNTDPKAAIITTYNFILGEIGVSQLIFYDDPEQPEGIFDEFLAIPAFTTDISTRTFGSLVTSAPSNATANQRGAFNTVSSTSLPIELLDAIVNQTTYVGTTSSLYSGTFISYDVEPFLSTVFSHAPANSSAYPPERSVGLLPLNLYYAWDSQLDDAYFHSTIVESAAVITDVAVSLGQDVSDAALYGNYAVAGTPLERIYGDNVEPLHELKLRYDPDNVMGLAGGWKF